MTLWHDVRFAIRLLLKDRWFTLAAAVALALGIGANAAVFTLVNAILLRDLPFDQPDRIVSILTMDDRNRGAGVSYSELRDWFDQVHTVDLCGYIGAPMNLSDEERAAEQFQGSYVSNNLFRLIGRRPVIGRDFTPEDDRLGADPVMMLGYSIWQSRYGGAPSVLGKSIKANSRVYTVVGVMPPDLDFPNNDKLWLPLAMLPDASRTPRRDVRNYNVIGRLAAGTTLPQARAEFAAIGKRLAEQYPATNKTFHPDLMTYNARVTGGDLRTIFLSLMGAVAFVLLIACANVANLLLARSAHRAREISIRVSLGAGRWRIIRQLLIESLLLAAVSGVIGFALAVAGVRWFDAMTQDVGKPAWMVFNMDVSVFAFVAAVCLGTAVLFGLAPALHVSKTDANETLKEGGRGGMTGVRARRWTSALIVSEVVLTLVLLAGAGFMIRSFMTMYSMNVGVDSSHLLTLQIFLPLTKYPQAGPRAEVYQRMEDRLRSVPGIQAGTITSNTPLGGGFTRELTIEGRTVSADEAHHNVTMVTVGDTYFDTLRIRLLRGRLLTATDGPAGHEAAVVNQRFVTLHFPQDDPIGHRIQLQSVPPSGTPPWTTIVGVVPNVRQSAFREREPDPVVYLPYRADAQRFGVMIVRAMGEPGQVTKSLRDAMRGVEPDLPLYDAQTLDTVLARQRWFFNVFGTMFGVFAAIALVLSTVGLYAVTAYSVTQRRQEIGVRMALGAQPRAMLWLVLRRALVQLAIGLPLGIAGAFAAGKLLASMLLEGGANDPATLAAIVLILVVSAVLACLWPARTAARLDPMIALRGE